VITVKILQSRSFQNKVKKLNKKEKLVLDAEINIIFNNPSIGIEKKGDLRGVFVHKFKVKAILYLLSYRLKEENLELIMLGPHENYYRDLKNYLKNQ
jgi:mRNA-degrading endonuclease RelE of RelBE toxin-antitoxin system